MLVFRKQDAGGRRKEDGVMMQEGGKREVRGRGRKREGEWMEEREMEGGRWKEGGREGG